MRGKMNPFPQKPEPRRNALKQARTKNPKQGLRDMQAIDTLKTIAGLHKRPPHSSLHNPGHLPFWMKSEVREAKTGQRTNLKITPDQTVRILQDTGHDIWLFLSRRGLEIRSFYLLPKTLAEVINARQNISTQDFYRHCRGLKSDVIEWIELLGGLTLSAHQRLEIINLQNSLPSPEEAEQRARSSKPVSVAQVQPGRLEIDMKPIPVIVLYEKNRSTEIFPNTPKYAGAYGYRYFGSFLFTSKANLIERTIATLTPGQRLALFIERCLSGNSKPTPFPPSDIFSNSSKGTS
jgi:hypothetical protein